MAVVGKLLRAIAGRAGRDSEVGERQLPVGMDGERQLLPAQRERALMPSHLTSPWNYAVSYLDMLYRDQTLGSGSGFFWKLDDRTFLISNWHNFSGLNAETGLAILSTAGRPDRITFTSYKQTSESDGDGFFEMSVVRVTVPLYDSDLSGPRWLHHPTFGRKVDIAAIDVSKAVTGLKVNHVNVVESDAVLQPLVSQDVFIVGYPLGLITGAPSPVWKRGTIATDPTFDPDGLPKMYVDSATREGMSGSVVVAKHIVLGQKITKKDGTETGPFLYAVRDVVLGIYSGRLGADLEKAQLGIVWKRSAIEETVNGNSVASV